MSLSKYPAPYWSKPPFLARDVFVRTNSRAIAMMFVRPSVRPSGTGPGAHCDHTVHFSADLSL